MPIEHTVRLHSGRVLEVVEAGDPKGVPVFGLHGTPGGRFLYPGHGEHATKHGIRLLGYGRPGYGGSTPERGRSMGDAAADVVAIADDLGIERFALWGHSGGGAPALGCAALLGSRLVAASSLAATAPYPTEGLDWTAGSGESNAADFRAMLADVSAWEANSERDIAAMATLPPDALRTLLFDLCSDVDRAAFSDELLAFLYRQSVDGLRSGWAGMRDDNLALIRPWGFDLDRIRVPVQIWHGDQDKFVPFSHGEWIARHVPGAEVHLQPGEGHLTLYLDRVLDAQRWLADRF
jgi:pimeloyl-ACP methyl ester carboxylesterase